MAYFPPGSCLFWGNQTIGALPDTRFLTPGSTVTSAALVSVCAYLLPKDGSLRALGVRHNTAVGNGNVVTYRVLINGVATTLTTTVATGAIVSGTDLVNTRAVVAGDVIEVTATKLVDIANGGINVMVTLEYL